MKAKVPAEGLTGKLKVTAGTLEAISAADFKVAPRITEVSVMAAEEGAEIIITGANFSENKPNNTISAGKQLLQLLAGFLLPAFLGAA